MRRGNSTSDVLSQNIPEIMTRWENRAVEEVSATFGHPSLLLRDSLPNLLRSLAILVSKKDRTQVQVELDAAELLKSSKEHGRGRAEMPTYLMSQMIFEYQILRQILFQFLEENSAFSVADREILTSSIEEAVNVAATEFALVIREIQDQFMLALAHDLKTPITATMAGADLIRRSPKSNATLPLAERMMQSMTRMTDMIEDVYDISRIEAGYKLTFPISDCDIEAILNDVVAEMKLVYGDYFVYGLGGVDAWPLESRLFTAPARKHPQ